MSELGLPGVPGRYALPAQAMTPATARRIPMDGYRLRIRKPRDLYEMRNGSACPTNNATDRRSAPALCPVACRVKPESAEFEGGVQPRGLPGQPSSRTAT